MYVWEENIMALVMDVCRRTFVFWSPVDSPWPPAKSWAPGFIRRPSGCVGHCALSPHWSPAREAGEGGPGHREAGRKGRWEPGVPHGRKSPPQSPTAVAGQAGASCTLVPWAGEREGVVRGKGSPPPAVIGDSVHRVQQCFGGKERPLRILIRLHSQRRHGPPASSGEVKGICRT